MKLEGPIFLMQPVPYFGEEIKGEWIYESKIDGWRLQIIKYSDEKIEFWGRRLEKNPNWTKELSYLSPFIQPFLPKGTLLDCELYSTEGRRGIPSVIKRTKRAEPLIYIFDVVFFENEFVGNLKLKERKKILENLKLKEPFFILKFKELNDLKKALKNAIEEGNEGIVIKELNSFYEISKDGPIANLWWRKIKPV